MPKVSEVHTLIEHFFRYESGKMIAVLTGLFGSNNIVLAEDLVQDTLMEAMANWTYKGIPENPSAWLYTVAKNKALNSINREKYRNRYALETRYEWQKSEETTMPEIFSPDNISDDQLRMMFLCCHPAISPDSQIALILKTLCGFSISEIGRAFMTSKENINKRLVRTRKIIRTQNISFNLPHKKHIKQRLDAVLETIYLLFNEGYSASVGHKAIREGLCLEAIRLTELVLANKAVDNKGSVYALLSLMQLNVSRFGARIDDQGNLRTLEKQNRSLWDMYTMEKGFANLKKATQDALLTKYHLLAGISSYHCSAKSFEATDWMGILSLYDRLLILDSSPLVVLNRVIVLLQIGKTQDALAQLGKIEKENALVSHHLFYAVKSDLYAKMGKMTEAGKSLQKAIDLAPLLAEKKLLRDRLKKISEKK
ncbi:MAG: sigma-70 family RNA polymerase sigma factor [Bacteroidota bacterium]